MTLIKPPSLSLSLRYGAVLEHLSRSNSKSSVIDLSPSSLLHYGGVDWLNANEFLGRRISSNKQLEINSMVFVFQKAVVFLCKGFYHLI